MHNNASATVLVVDDEANLRKVLAALLRKEGYHVLTAATGEEGLALLQQEQVEVLLTDLRMPGLDGMAVLQQAVAQKPGLPVVMLTAHGTVDTAVDAMQSGAFDYLTKPFDKDELSTIIKKAIATAGLQAREPEAEDSKEGRYGIIGQSPALTEVFRGIEKVADSPSTVLIMGESGTGKELVAQALHQQSSRRNKPLIKINCAAIPQNLIESELFGYERGAFTGAVTSKPGRFELAHEGTLFLDEINSIPLAMQVKLLRALQESEFERVGGVRTTKVDVRLVAATNRDLAAEVEAGRFRGDLYYRLNVVPMSLPPLRERVADIPLLANHFIEKYNRRLGKQVSELSPEALQILQSYAFPGNVRELENTIERAMLFCEGSVITEKALPEAVLKCESEATTDKQSPAAQIPKTVTPIGPLKEIVRKHTNSLEKELITRALEETGGNVTKAARRLEISRKSLQNKMRDLGLREEAEDPGSSET